MRALRSSVGCGVKWFIFWLITIISFALKIWVFLIFFLLFLFLIFFFIFSNINASTFRKQTKAKEGPWEANYYSSRAISELMHKQNINYWYLLQAERHCVKRNENMQGPGGGSASHIFVDLEGGARGSAAGKKKNLRPHHLRNFNFKELDVTVNIGRCSSQK